MSLFICAHGELYSKCKYCSDFEVETEDKEYDENEPALHDIVNRLKKEKIEY